MKRKEICLLKGDRKESYGQFRSRVFKIFEPLERLESIDFLKITLTDIPPPGISVIPFKRSKIAAISIIWKNQPGDTSFLKIDGYVGRYIVEEAMPVSYTMNWDIREKTPGVCLLTLFHSRTDINYDTFIDRWHNSHTPLSLKLHPLWNYNRNVVKERMDEDSVTYDGIVEEQVRTRRDLLNPFRFFGPFPGIIRNMMLVYRDTKSFIDYKRIETYLANEYIVIS